MSDIPNVVRRRGDHGGASRRRPAQEQHGDLARQLANPISPLISVPLQNNIECCYGPENATRYTLNVQPLVPVSLGQD